MKTINILSYVAFFYMLLFCFTPVIAIEKKDDDHPIKSDIFVRLLGEQLSGEVADYMNSAPEWQLVMESRIRLLMFTYWVNVTRFEVPRVEMLEKRFGELVQLIARNKAFQRTFIEPHFIKNSEAFPIHGFVSMHGERFEIKSIEEFEALNKKFLDFLGMCATKTDRSKHNKSE